MWCTYGLLVGQISKKIGYRYVCSNKRKTKCSGTVDPLLKTFFEKKKISFCDILAIIFCFILKLSASFCVNLFCYWRGSRNESPMQGSKLETSS